MVSLVLDKVDVSFPLYNGKSNTGVHFLKNLVGYRGNAGEYAALSDISFHLKEGDKLALIGRNGAGKTTLLKVMAGILPPVKGNISVGGEVFAAIDMNQTQMQAATCWQNIYLNAAYYGYKGDELAEYVNGVAKSSELGDFLNSPLSALSKGMKNRLSVSIAAYVNPDVLLMDEWIGTVDKKVTEKHEGAMRKLIDKTKICAIASHRESLLRSLCNKSLVLEKGKIIFFGDLDEGFELYSKL